MKKAVLEILDEVNVKFRNLDIVTRRSLAKKLKFVLPYARHLPAVKLGRWDGSISFCDMAGRTYINVLDRLLPIIQSAGYDLEIVDHRQAHAFAFEEVQANDYQHILWPEGHRFVGQPVILEDHQVAAANQYLNNLQAVQSISTGAGKTLLTAVLSHKVEPYGRSIVIVPSKDLVTQTEEQYRNLGLDVGVFYGDRKEYGKTHTICTWQSLNILDEKSKQFDTTFDIATFIEGVVCIMVDECFHGDTPVLTPQGYVPIQHIQEGDEVINRNDDTGEFKVDVVIKKHENLVNNQSEDMLELEFDNGTVLKVTANHRFLTGRGWVRADQLTLKDFIIEVNRT